MKSEHCTPWCDMKVAYDLNNPERFWRAYEAGKIALPAGWEFNETDCAGARCVAIFRIEVFPTIEDGRAVKAMIRRFGR
jgi:hypothetical protein